jgi:undecaprenyl-diphosphatase
MLAVRYLGDDAVAVGSVLLLAGVLAGRRRWPEAVAFLSVLPLEVLLRLPKALVDRPRPVEELVRVLDSGSSGSFPSGHVFHAVAMLGLALVILVFPIRSAWPRRVASVVLVAMIFLSGLSRVYLGAHWPSDVIGSLAYGVPSVVLLYCLCVRLKRRWAQG